MAANSSGDSTDVNTPARADIDEKALKLFGLKVWTYKMGEVVSLMVHLGDQLGIYKSMQGQGFLSSDALAERTGLNERMLREWLFGQAAAGLIDHGPDTTFELNDVQAAILAREDDSVDFACGTFTGGARQETVEALLESFRTGIGMTYEQQGTAATAGMARMTAPRSKLALVSSVVPSIEGLEARLTAGASVVEVGCGAGVALLTLAEAFPNSTFVGIDPSTTAITMAAEQAAADNLTNISFKEGFAADVEPSGNVDLAIAFDCLHDMPRPDVAVTAIGAAMADDGIFLVKDIRSSGDFEQDNRNPLLALMYGFSVSSCLQSAMSEPDGMALGTVGLHPERLTQLVKDNGFTTATMHDFGDPSNLFYEVRK